MEIGWKIHEMIAITKSQTKILDSSQLARNGISSNETHEMALIHTILLPNPHLMHNLVLAALLTVSHVPYGVEHSILGGAILLHTSSNFSVNLGMDPAETSFYAGVKVAGLWLKWKLSHGEDQEDDQCYYTKTQQNLAYLWRENGISEISPDCKWGLEHETWLLEKNGCFCTKGLCWFPITYLYLRNHLLLVNQSPSKRIWLNGKMISEIWTIYNNEEII